MYINTIPISGVDYALPHDSFKMFDILSALKLILCLHCLIMNSIANKKRELNYLLHLAVIGLFALYSRILCTFMKNISQKSRHYGNFMIHFHRKNIISHSFYSSINTIMTALPYLLKKMFVSNIGHIIAPNF